MSSTTQTNYVNITSITVSLKASETPANVANFIMYEDTNNQCVSKLPTALDYYKGLTSAGKTEFQTSGDYVISTARTRLEAWASSQGKTINYSTGTLSSKATILNPFIGDNDSTTLIVIIAFASVGSLAVLLFIKKKRLHN